MFNNPIFSCPIFALNTPVSNDDLDLELETNNDIYAMLTYTCHGMRCNNCKKKCARWKLKRGMNTVGKAYIPAIVICNQKFDLCEDV